MTLLHQFDSGGDVSTPHSKELSKEITIFPKYFPLIAVATDQLTTILHNPINVVTMVRETDNMNQIVEVYLPDMLNEVWLIDVPQNHIN